MIRFALMIAAAQFALAAPPASAAVDVREVTSPGGIRAWLVEESAIPFVALEIRFVGGTALDAPGKRGAIGLMTGLLEEGAGDLDARGFAEARDRLAARIAFHPYDDAVSISAQFLTENRDDSVALLKSALEMPRFDRDAIKRVRSQVHSIIGSDSKDPNEIARRRMDELAFGDHPYGSSGDGTEKSVNGLRRGDLFAAKDRVLARDRLFVGAAGDISPEELGALLDELLGGLPATGAPMPGQAEYLLEGGLTVVPFDTPQSVALFGHEGISRDHPDFFAAFVLNHILGGSGFEARLMTEVREKRGLTYGIRTFLADLEFADLVIGQVASANDRIAEAIEVIRGEWARIAENGVTERELDEAKTYLTGAYPLRFDGNSEIARIMVGMQIAGLPADYIATRNDMVNAVTLEDARRVARELYDPDELHFVVVGQPVGLDSTN